MAFETAHSHSRTSTTTTKKGVYEEANEAESSAIRSAYRRNPEKKHKYVNSSSDTGCHCKYDEWPWLTKEI